MSMTPQQQIEFLTNLCNQQAQEISKYKNYSAELKSDLSNYHSLFENTEEAKAFNVFNSHPLGHSLNLSVDASEIYHSDDIAIDNTSTAMKVKMAYSRAKGRHGWDKEECSPERLAIFMMQHIPKGDPLDIAIYAMMLHNKKTNKSTLHNALDMFFSYNSNVKKACIGSVQMPITKLCHHCCGEDFDNCKNESCEGGFVSAKIDVPWSTIKDCFNFVKHELLWQSTKTSNES